MCERNSLSLQTRITEYCATFWASFRDILLNIWLEISVLVIIICLETIKHESNFLNHEKVPSFFFSIFKSLQREMLECLEFPTSNCNSSSFSIENFFAIPSVAVKSVIIFLFIRLLNYHPSSNSSFRSSEFRTLLNGCENQTVDFEILAANQMLYGLISNRRSIIKVDIHFLNASVFLIKSNKRTRRRESQVIIENLWEKSPIKFKSNILKNSHHEIKSLFFILLHFEIFSDSLTLSFLSSIGLFECLETSKIIWNSFKMISNSSQTVGRMSRFVW